MDDEGGLENSLTELRVRVAQLEWILVAVFGMILAFHSFVILSALWILYQQIVIGL